MTRVNGSWLDDGFEAGDIITGSASGGRWVITNIDSPTVMTVRDYTEYEALAEAIFWPLLTWLNWR